MVEGAALNSDERAWDICAGDRPRARSALILAAMDSNSSLRAVHPAPGGGQLAVGQQLGAGRGVLAAERHRAVVAAPVAAVADVRPAAEPGAGALGDHSTLDPLPGPRVTVRLRLTSSATLDWDLPRSRAIARAGRFLSSPRSIVALSARSSLL